MTIDCGIVGDSTLRAWVEPMAQWCTVAWGTDDPIDAVRRIQNRDPVTVVFVAASVHHLTSLLMSIAAEYGVRIVAIVADDTSEAWVDAVGNIDSVRTPADVARVLGAEVATAEPGTWLESDSAVAAVDPVTPAAIIRDDVGTEAVARGHDANETIELHTGTPIRRMVAVWGPIGSPGRSTVAIGLAVAAAEGGASVLLIDADSYGSSLAIGLGLLDEAPGFAACCRLAGMGELNPDHIIRLSERVVRNGLEFSVLTGIPRANRWGETERQRAQCVIACARDMFDVVVVDCGFSVEDNDWIDAIAPSRNGTTQMMLSEADETVVVGLSDPVGVARLIRGVDDIAEWCDNPIVVLNRTSNADATQARSALRRFSAVEPRVVIPPDSRTGLHDALDRARGATALRELAKAVGLVGHSMAPRRWLFGR